jgi:hypothetical protein
VVCRSTICIFLEQLALTSSHSEVSVNKESRS